MLELFLGKYVICEIQLLIASLVCPTVADTSTAVRVLHIRISPSRSSLVHSAIDVWVFARVKKKKTSKIREV